MARVTGSESRTPRQRRRGSTPTCSVVIVAISGGQALESCVKRLSSACQRFGAEMLIVVPSGESGVAAIRKQYPDARVIAAPVDLPADDLRSLGLLEAAGDIVAFTDDADARGEEWLGVLERRARNAGGYGPEPNGKIDWPAYLAARGLLHRNGSSPT